MANSSLKILLPLILVSAVSVLAYTYNNSFINAYYDFFEKAFPSSPTGNELLVYYPARDVELCVYPSYSAESINHTLEEFRNLLRLEFGINIYVEHSENLINCSQSDIYVSLYENRIPAVSMAVDLQKTIIIHNALEVDHKVRTLPGGYLYSPWGYIFNYASYSDVGSRFSYVAIGLAENEGLDEQDRTRYVKGVLIEELFHAISFGRDTIIDKEDSVNSILHEPNVGKLLIEEEEDIRNFLDLEMNLKFSLNNERLCLYDLISIYVLTQNRPGTGINYYSKPARSEIRSYRDKAKDIIESRDYEQIVSSYC